jgi:hypothetical protein
VESLVERPAAHELSDDAERDSETDTNEGQHGEVLQPCRNADLPAEQLKRVATEVSRVDFFDCDDPTRRTLIPQKHVTEAARVDLSLELQVAAIQRPVLEFAQKFSHLFLRQRPIRVPIRIQTRLKRLNSFCNSRFEFVVLFDDRFKLLDEILRIRFIVNQFLFPIYRAEIPLSEAELASGLIERVAKALKVVADIVWSAVEICLHPIGLGERHKQGAQIFDK